MRQISVIPMILPLCLLAACGERAPLSLGLDGAAASDGAVQTDGPASGGDSAAAPWCSTNAQCKAGAYCHLDSSCLASGAKLGQCTARPTACPEYYAPTCGCDGKTYGSPCDAHSSGVNVKHAGACTPDAACQGVTCNVYNDCCMCEASKYDYYPPPCPAKCKQPQCDGMGIHEPAAYCLAGQCLLENTLKGCTADSDCYKADDCCFCLALPKSVPFPPCAADCFVGRCTGLGLGKAVARCVGGRCRLALP